MDVIITKLADKRTKLYNGRFYASKRIDWRGRKSWRVWDLKINNYSTFLCFGSYRLMRDCEWAIQQAVMNSEKLGINLK